MKKHIALSFTVFFFLAALLVVPCYGDDRCAIKLATQHFAYPNNGIEISDFSCEDPEGKNNIAFFVTGLIVLYTTHAPPDYKSKRIILWDEARQSSFKNSTHPSPVNASESNIAAYCTK